MDSDDYDDLGDASLWSAGPGPIALVVAIVFALVFYGIASSKRQNENAQCNDRCAPHAGMVIKTNAGEDALTCMCKWEDGSLHVPAPTAQQMIAP